MKRVRVFALAAALSASLTLASAGSTNEPVDGYVFDAMSAATRVSYVATVEAVRIGSEGSQASVYRVEHRAPNFTKRSYLSPSNLRGDAIVTKGDDSFAIDPKRRRVVESVNDALDDKVALDDNYALLRSNYRAVKQSSDSFDGRRVEAIELINKYTHRTTMLLRIDSQTKLVLDKQQFAADGSLESETRFEDIRYTPRPSASDFSLPKTFKLVKGANFGQPSTDPKRVASEAGFPARSPKFLPDGFEPVEGSVITIKGTRVLHLLYSDGICTLSLFEHAGTWGLNMARFHPEPANIDGYNAEYAAIGPTALLTWNDGQLRYTLVGDLPRDALQRIAASIAP